VVLDMAGSRNDRENRVARTADLVGNSCELWD
jgi:hypothetical protein